MASQALLAARSAARAEIVPLTVDDVLTGNIRNFHSSGTPNNQGQCYNWRLNGIIQLWKTRPREFRQPVKFGLRDFNQITQHNVQFFHDGDKCPVDEASVDPRS